MCKVNDSSHLALRLNMFHKYFRYDSQELGSKKGRSLYMEVCARLAGNHAPIEFYFFISNSRQPKISGSRVTTNTHRMCQHALFSTQIACRWVVASTSRRSSEHPEFDGRPDARVIMHGNSSKCPIQIEMRVPYIQYLQCIGARPSFADVLGRNRQLRPHYTFMSS